LAKDFIIDLDGDGLLDIVRVYNRKKGRKKTKVANVKFGTSKMKRKKKKREKGGKKKSAKKKSKKKYPVRVQIGKHTKPLGKQIVMKLKALGEKTGLIQEIRSNSLTIEVKRRPKYSEEFPTQYKKYKSMELNKIFYQKIKQIAKSFGLNETDHITVIDNGDEIWIHYNLKGWTLLKNRLPREEFKRLYKEKKIKKGPKGWYIKK